MICSRVAVALMSAASSCRDDPFRALGVGKPFQAIWHVASQHPLPAARRRF